MIRARRKKSLLHYIKMAIALIFGVVGMAIGGLALALLSWVVAGIGGYVIGLVLNFLFGSVLAEGLNIIFNTGRFTPQMLPYITTVLAVFSNFIKPFINIKVNAKQGD